MANLSKTICVFLVLLISLQPAASAQEGTFTLGQITVTSAKVKDVSIGDNVVTSDEVWSFDKGTLDDAVKLIPGVTSTLDSNGRRNEHDILVRGFGRLQAPLSIDGIRVYLPADNRLDFSRFLTSDLSQIQVQKGYVSVLEGPGGMGGAINLVTRKPVRAFEAEVESGASMDNDSAYSGWNGYGRLGTKQEKYYLQASGSYLDRDHWRLPDNFRPTPIQDGGDRNRSDTRDSRVNVKAGFTPNETDEYSLSYTSQSGSKGAPLNVNNNPPNPPNSYWDWPWWDIENLYFLSTTQLGESSYVKTRLFYNTFDNALDAYDNGTYTTQSANGRFRSIYDDKGYGGSIELGTTLFSRNTLKGAVHYRKDEHTERNFNRPTHPTLSSVEPLQKTLENTWSLALENTFHATPAFDFVAGVSYDKNDLDKAQEFNTTAGMFDSGLIDLATGGSNAVNGQGAVLWHYNDANELRASVSSRTRFPTIFERFSTRFGTAVPNPDLDAERAINYELAWEGSALEHTSLSAAVFYNDVKNMIQTIVVSGGPPQLTQTQNVGDGEYYGVELGADSQLTAHLRIGANYTYLERKINDPLQPNFRPTGTPTHQGLLFASYRPLEALTITPSVELADDRWSDLTAGGYRETGAYTLVGLQVQYRYGDSWEAALGGRNLLDDNYQLADGFPDPGRSFYGKFRIRF